jgi:membrane-associated phospholipid phosphatase
MPPVLSQDPFEAVHRAVQARWLDVPMAILSALADGWVLALVALAIYAWLEPDLGAVARAYLPLAAALAVAAGAVFALRTAWTAPRPAGTAAAPGLLDPVLRHGFPGGQALYAATFAAYTVRRYRRGGLFALAFPLAAGVARVYAGPAWPVEIAGGFAAGTALGLSAGWAAARLAPRLP